MNQEWMQAEWESMPEATLAYIDVCVELEYLDQWAKWVWSGIWSFLGRMIPPTFVDIAFKQDFLFLSEPMAYLWTFGDYIYHRKNKVETFISWSFGWVRFISFQRRCGVPFQQELIQQPDCWSLEKSSPFSSRRMMDVIHCYVRLLECIYQTQCFYMFLRWVDDV